jgi:hypothetical protein
VTGDRAVRWATVTAVLAVAAVAALISYRHAVAVVTGHGESGMVGHLYPVVIDGLIVAASMVLLDAARHRDPAPRLAASLLTAGIAATLAANVLAGTGYGPLGAVVAAWPALAFVGCYELLMLLVRASARRARAGGPPLPPAAPALAPAPKPPAKSAPKRAKTAAPEVHFADALTAGELPSVRRIRRELRVGQPKAQEVQARLAASMNGHAPG